MRTEGEAAALRHQVLPYLGDASRQSVPTLMELTCTRSVDRPRRFHGENESSARLHILMTIFANLRGRGHRWQYTSLRSTGVYPQPLVRGARIVQCYAESSGELSPRYASTPGTQNLTWFAVARRRPWIGSCVHVRVRELPTADRPQGVMAFWIQPRAITREFRPETVSVRGRRRTVCLAARTTIRGRPRSNSA